MVEDDVRLRTPGARGRGVRSVSLRSARVLQAMGRKRRQFAAVGDSRDQHVAANVKLAPLNQQRVVHVTLNEPCHGPGEDRTWATERSDTRRVFFLY